MSRPVMTYAIAHAAGMDAGNASMRKAGRRVWSIEDRDVAARETNRLLDLMPDAEPTEPAAWGRWAAAQGMGRGDAQDIAQARFMGTKPLYPGDPTDVALQAYDDARRA